MIRTLSANAEAAWLELVDAAYDACDDVDSGNHRCDIQSCQDLLCTFDPRSSPYRFPPLPFGTLQDIALS